MYNQKIQFRITLLHKDGTTDRFITDPGTTFGITAIGYGFTCRNQRYLVHPKNFIWIIDEEIKSE